MSNADATDRLPSLQTVELLADFSRKAASGDIAVQDPIGRFLDRLMDDGLFECAVVVTTKSLLGRNNQMGWPLVIASAEDARGARTDLERIMRAGFQVIVGTKSSLRDLQSVFEGLGYEETGQGTYGDGGRFDPVQAASDRGGFSRAVAVARKLCHKALCVFAHDGDPVYLMCE